jgi:hypothetical protein
MMLRRWALLGASFIVPLSAFASCAGTESAHDASPNADAASHVPALDGGGDAPDGNAAALSCKDVPWCPVPANISAFAALTSIWGASKNDVWAVGSNGTVMHWDGTEWSSTPVKLQNTFNTVWGSGPNDVWIASALDTVFHSNGYAGAATEWRQVQMPVGNAPVFTIWGTSADDVHVAGEAFGISDDTGFAWVNTFTKTTIADGGTEWRAVQGTESVLSMWGSARDVWLAADNSMYTGWQRALTLHGTANADGGKLTWTELDSRSSVTLRALWGSSADDVWAVGDIGTIRHVTSATATEWQVVSSPTREYLNAIWGSARDDVWAVGDNGTILHYDGQAWSTERAAFPPGKKPALYGIWGSARDDVWIVGDGVVLRYTGGPLGDAGGSP